MSPNLNPNVNLACATIAFNENTGQMEIRCRSGFQTIEQGATTAEGVYFVLEEGSFDENTFAIPVVCYQKLDTKPPATYIPLVSCNILAPMTTPFDSEGKTVLQVVGWSIQSGTNRGPDVVPFVLIVQQLNPGYIAPETPIA